MPDLERFTRRDDPLPGLEPADAHASDIEIAARRTIDQLESLGLLDERHSIVCQTLLELAREFYESRGRAKAYAVANLAAQILAAYTLLMPDAAGGGDSDEWSDLMADIRRSAAEARDTADTGSPE